MAEHTTSPHESVPVADRAPEVTLGRPTFAELLSEAMERQQVSLSRLRQRLIDSGNPVALSTLSQWRSGRRRPEGPVSEAVVEEIEQLLDLPPGRLSYRLTSSRRPGAGHHGAAHRGAGRLDTAIRMLSADLGYVDEAAVEVFFSHVVIEVGPDRQIAQVTRRSVVRARADATDRVLFIFAFPELADLELDRLERFEVTLGGRLGPVGRDETGAVFGCAVLLDPHLERGETSVHEVRFAVAPGAGNGYSERTLNETYRDQILWVRFSPEVLPRVVTTFTDSADRHRSRTLAPSGTGCYHLAHRDFGPGVAGLQWEW